MPPLLFYLELKTIRFVAGQIETYSGWGSKSNVIHAVDFRYEALSW